MPRLLYGGSLAVILICVAMVRSSVVFRGSLYVAGAALYELLCMGSACGTDKILLA